MRATVLIPTYDHGPGLLAHALRSVQEQTVLDIEILVVGDGAASDLVARTGNPHDARVRYFENPKGEGQGEQWRHEAIQQSRGDVICYQADDDLWQSRHLERLLELLEHADFAHTTAIDVDAHAGMFPWLALIDRPAFRNLMLAGHNFLPLSVVGHTRAAYDALEHGWRPAPAGMPSDLFMWQQFLAADLRYAGTHVPTVLHFPSPHRVGWTLEEREAELAAWEGADLGRMTTRTLARARRLDLSPDGDLLNNWRNVIREAAL